jgi:hypothetical protein
MVNIKQNMGATLPINRVKITKNNNIKLSASFQGIGVQIPVTG